MNNLLKKSLSVIAALTLSTQLYAATGQTSVSFNFPNIVILHYVSSVNFDIPATAFGSNSIDEGTGGTLNTFVSPNISGNSNVGMTIAQALTGYTGTINNAWAVRALAGAGGVNVSVAINTADALNGTSKVTIANAIVSDGTNTGATINFASPGLSSANAVYGSVGFDIDFTNTTLAGLHTGAQYTVTAVAL